MLTANYLSVIDCEHIAAIGNEGHRSSKRKLMNPNLHNNKLPKIAVCSSTHVTFAGGPCNRIVAQNYTGSCRNTKLMNDNLTAQLSTTKLYLAAADSELPPHGSEPLDVISVSMMQSATPTHDVTAKPSTPPNRQRNQPANDSSPHQTRHS